MPFPTYEPGSVLIVPFPFTDIAVQKRRPALAISNQTFQADHGHVPLAMITSGIGSRWPSDIPLTELDGTGLTKACVVRLKLFTLESGLISGCVGRLGDADWGRVVKALLGILPEAAYSRRSD